MPRLPIPLRDRVSEKGLLTRIWREWFRGLSEQAESGEDAEYLSSLPPRFDHELGNRIRDELRVLGIKPQQSFRSELDEIQAKLAQVRMPSQKGQPSDEAMFALLTHRWPQGKDSLAERGTHANRPSASARPDGFIYQETDREVFYVSIDDVWYYVAGQMSGTIDPATADQKPGDLGTADENFRFWSTDFAREYRWNGSAWADSPGAPERQQYGLFHSAPGTGWQLCDGSTVTRSNASGGVTVSYTVPDHSTAEYLKLSNSLSLNVAASGNVAAESAHTHAVNVPNTTSGGPSATTTVDNDGLGSTVAVGSDVHTHDTNPGSFTSGAGSAHQHGPGDLELAHSEILTYIRL